MKGGERRPQLLFLSQTLPYPPDGGVAIRTYNVLRLLAEAFDVTALCFYRSKGGATERTLAASLDRLRELAEVEAFPIPQEHSRTRLLTDHLWSATTRRVYTRYAYRSGPFQRRLEELLRTRQFHMAHADSMDLSGYFPALAGIPLVCVHHNHESRLLARRADVEESVLRRRYLQLQARLMAGEERTWCPRVALNVTVSEEDAATLKDLVRGGRFHVVPNGVDIATFRPASAAPDPARLVFVGGSTWFPNRDALAYFARDILPEIRRLAGPVTTHWVGRAMGDDRRRYEDCAGLELVGYVEDIRPYVHSAGCYVVPLRVGGGTRLKILDAWAMGKAVVSTAVGCEGLDARDGENILIRDDPGEFAQAVAAVLRDRELRDRLGTEARRTAEDTYSWTAIGASMRTAYQALLRHGAGAVTTA